MSDVTQTEPVETAASPALSPAQYLTFMLAGEMFAIGILCIKEIIEFPHLTEVPMMPDSVRGVINLRGAVVPVMDVQARFGRKPSGMTKRTCIIIVELQSEGDSQVIGISVDAVNEVIDIADSDIEAPPPFGVRIRAEFMRGVVKVKGQFVVLLDVEAVLSLDGAESSDEPQALHA